MVTQIRAMINGLLNFILEPCFYVFNVCYFLWLANIERFTHTDWNIYFKFYFINCSSIWVSEWGEGFNNKLYHFLKSFDIKIDSAIFIKPFEQFTVSLGYSATKFNNNLVRISSHTSQRPIKTNQAVANSVAHVDLMYSAVVFVVHANLLFHNFSMQFIVLLSAFDAIFRNSMSSVPFRDIYHS